MKMTCKLVEASFDSTAPPDTYGVRRTPTLTASCPDPSEFDLGTVAEVGRFTKAVKTFGDSVDVFESAVEDYATAVEEAIDGVEPAQAFAPFTNESMNRVMELSGFNTHDEVIVLLRGDYDRLAHAADEECACVFGSDGRCIHRGCGLTTADWEIRETASA